MNKDDYKDKLADSCQKLMASGIISQEQKDKCMSIKSLLDKRDLEKKIATEEKIFGKPDRDQKIIDYNKFINEIDDVIDATVKNFIENKANVLEDCDHATINTIVTLDKLMNEMIKHVNNINYDKYYRNELKHNDEIRNKYVDMDIRRKKLDKLNGNYDTLQKIEENSLEKVDNNNYLYFILLIMMVVAVICLLIYIIKFLK